MAKTPVPSSSIVDGAGVTAPDAGPTRNTDCPPVVPDALATIPRVIEWLPAPRANVPMLNPVGPVLVSAHPMFNVPVGPQGLPLPVVADVSPRKPVDADVQVPEELSHTANRS